VVNIVLILFSYCYQLWWIKDCQDCHKQTIYTDYCTSSSSYPKSLALWLFTTVRTKEHPNSSIYSSKTSLDLVRNVLLSKIMFVRIRSLSNAVTYSERAYFAPKHTEVTSSSPTSSVTWLFDTPCAISYRCSIVTESVSPAIFEIMGPKHFGVTTLTFQGHVTSSIMWPIDSS